MKKINVSKEQCIGCGACVAIDSEHFEFDDNKRSSVISNDNLDSANLTNAIESCPSSAISIVDDDVEENSDNDNDMKKINVSKEQCIGCGACVAIDSEHFDFDDNGRSSVISNDNLDSANLTNAIESCPTSAISIVDDIEGNSDNGNEDSECTDCCHDCNCCHSN